MAITIDTQSAQYQQYLTGLQNLIDFYKPKFVLFKKLPLSKQKLWLQKDPLFRKILKLGVIVGDWVVEYREDVQND